MSAPGLSWSPLPLAHGALVRVGATMSGHSKTPESAMAAYQLIGEQPTLTDFLLARIAEDEAWNRQNHGGDPLHPGSITRVKAECEAKRRIVEMFKPQCDPGCDHPPFSDDAPIVRLLALPYADHPDYDAAWKP